MEEMNGREIEIQFKDEGGETVGVSPVTHRFLERFSGHVSPFHMKSMRAPFRGIASGSSDGNSNRRHIFIAAVVVFADLVTSWPKLHSNSLISLYFCSVECSHLSCL